MRQHHATNQPRGTQERCAQRSQEMESRGPGEITACGSEDAGRGGWAGGQRGIWPRARSCLGVIPYLSIRDAAAGVCGHCGLVQPLRLFSINACCSSGPGISSPLFYTFLFHLPHCLDVHTTACPKTIQAQKYPTFPNTNLIVITCQKCSNYHIIGLRILGVACEGAISWKFIVNCFLGFVPINNYTCHHLLLNINLLQTSPCDLTHFVTSQSLLPLLFF